MILPWTKNMTWVWRLHVATWLLGKPVKLQPGQAITQAYRTPWLCYPVIANPANVWDEMQSEVDKMLIAVLEPIDKRKK